MYKRQILGGGKKRIEQQHARGKLTARERLALLYGERASLELEENAPRGFRARIVLPREAPSPSVPFVPVMAAPR